MYQALVKGTGIKYFNDFLEKSNPLASRQFKERLTSEEYRLFEKILPVSWVPIDLASKLYSCCATVLYPKDPECIEKLASRVAQQDFTGIYKILFKIISLNKLMEKSAKLWRINHQKGEAIACTSVKERKGILEITDYQELTECYSRVTAGYVKGLVMLTLNKNIAVQVEHPKSDTWRWVVTWS